FVICTCSICSSVLVFSFLSLTSSAPSQPCTFSLHDALPICRITRTMPLSWVACPVRHGSRRLSPPCRNLQHRRRARAPPGRSEAAMLLRPRQKQFVERSVRALDEHGNTLGVAPTGAGKTIMLSGVVGRMVGETPKSTGAKACVLAHRDELTAQDPSRSGRVEPRITTSVVDAKEKSWAGQVTFAMVPTLARAGNLGQLPALDLLVIDEAHHAAADSYRRIIDAALQRNPECRVYGVTATPNRGDKR